MNYVTSNKSDKCDALTMTEIINGKEVIDFAKNNVAASQINFVWHNSVVCLKLYYTYAVR